MNTTRVQNTLGCTIDILNVDNSTHDAIDEITLQFHQVLQCYQNAYKKSK